jgi:ABC-type uncharacterized transport system substrate-binding protein
MRILIPVLLILLCAMVYAETRSAPPVTITLTTDQVNMVSAAGARGATITLNTSQLDLLKQSYPNIKKNTVLVAPSNMNSKHQIKLIVDAAGEANPQPSP